MTPFSRGSFFQPPRAQPWHGPGGRTSMSATRGLLPMSESATVPLGRRLRTSGTILKSTARRKEPRGVGATSETTTESLTPATSRDRIIASGPAAAGQPVSTQHQVNTHHEQRGGATSSVARDASPGSVGEGATDLHARRHGAQGTDREGQSLVHVAQPRGAKDCCC